MSSYPPSVICFRMTVEEHLLLERIHTNPIPRPCPIVWIYFPVWLSVGGNAGTMSGGEQQMLAVGVR